MNQLTGCLKRTDRCGDVFPVFEDSGIDIIPRANWREIIAARKPLRPLVQKIKYQRYGSCASHATTQAFEVAWCQAYGVEDWIEFSPMAIYPFVSSRANSGSTIGDNMRYVQQSGLLPIASDKNRSFLRSAELNESHVRDENDYYGRFPDEWEQTAANFVAAEVFDISSLDGIVTALIIGCPVVVGRSGHAICYIDPHMSGNSLSFVYANSWSINWGDSGFGVDQESAISRAVQSYGAFAIRTVKVTDTFIRLMRD